MNVCGLTVGLFLALCAVGIALMPVLSQKRSPQILAWTSVVASLVLLGGSVWTLITGQVSTTQLWSIPPLGALHLRLDALSALFAAVSSVVFLCVSVFGAGLPSRHQGRYGLRAYGVMYLALYASVLIILVAGDLLTFVLAWEAMSIFTYILVNANDENATHTRAGYVMLAFSEAGTLAAIVGLLILAGSARSLDFSDLTAAASALSPGEQWAVFLLTFFGFAVKAGLAPVNSWLPRAYTAAPAAFAPVLAGGLLTLGFYGIMRVNLAMVHVMPLATGLIVLIVGAISALIGILYATTENDLKTMLAHSSIENAGLVTVALGAGFVFTASHFPALGAMAFVTAVYHLVNHSFYKTLLFMGAGTVEAQAGTRNLDKLGGLIRVMPWTAACFLVGVMSIAALPPFNGFVSEWLTLQTVLRSVELSSVGVKIVFAVCGAGLALTAGLAVTCFVKAFAMGFLGMSRSDRAEPPSEARRTILAPMALLAALCFGLGVAPTYVIPALAPAVAPAEQHDVLNAMVPPFFATSLEHKELPTAFAADFRALGSETGESVLPGRGLVVMHRGGEKNSVVFAMSTSYMLVVLVVLLGVLYGIVRLALAPRRKVTRRACWDGGIHRLLPEMTYSATGFSNPVRVIFDAIYHPTTAEHEPDTVAAHFRTAIHRQRQEVHIIDRVFLRPVNVFAMGLAKRLAAMHHGRMNAYLGYVLLALLLALLVARAAMLGS